MKIISAIASILALVATLSGCSIPLIRDGGNDMQIAKERFDSIIEALENKDSDALKAMFSEKAKEEATNLDEGIEYIMNFYQGKMISKDGVTPSEENFNAGERKLTIKGDYTVTTDKDTYSLFFIEKRNTADPNEDGLYMLRILKECDNIKYGGNRCAGIVLPKMITANDLLDTTIWTLKNNNIELNSIFSSNAIKEAIDFDKNSTTAKSLFIGKNITLSKEIETSVENEGDNVVTKGYYEVTTSDLETEEIVGTYLVYFVHKRNETDPDEDGLYTLEVAKKTNESTELSRSDTAGIIVS